MKPEFKGVTSFRRIDRLINTLVEDIEKLTVTRKPHLAYLFAIPLEISDVKVVACNYRKNCPSFDLTFQNSGLSLIADDRFPRLPEETLVDFEEMRKLAYWLSLLNLSTNVRVWNGNIQYRAWVLKAIDDIMYGFATDDLEIVHGVISSNR